VVFLDKSVTNEKSENAGKEKHEKSKTSGNKQKDESVEHNKSSENRMEIEELKDELMQNRETMLRIQAEFDNFQKRTEKEKARFLEFADAGLVKELLALLDSMDSAVEKHSGNKEYCAGIESLQNQLKAILKARGLEEISAVGKKFDPLIHECVVKESNPKMEDNIVLEELQKGYLFKGSLLRPSKVKINDLEQN
jgi:molecular chaperone GrpE